jgi:hypothetical protein
MSDSVTVEESLLAAVSDVGDASEACSLLQRSYVNRDTSTLVEFASWRSLLEKPTRAFSFLRLHA